MMSIPTTDNACTDRDPIVVLAADERFAMPLAVTVRSAIENLAPDRVLRVYVLDGGIQPATKERLLRSWPQAKCHVQWLAVDAAVLAGLPVSSRVNLVGYYRILMPRLLPGDVERIIYLDCDLIVRRDLARLWNQDLSGQLCLAVPDCSAPFMDSSTALANFDRCGPYLSAAQPVRNFCELGLAPQAAYFNSGVLLVDLTAWRKADLPRAILECLATHREHVQWWDQYALNVVLAGRWGALDLRWNQGSHIFSYPDWEHSPFDRQTFEQLRDDPYIIHFTTRMKPWRGGCRHPLRAEFFDYLDRTAWAHWRPPKLEAVLEMIKVQERRLRKGRRWLRDRAREWLFPRHRAA